MTAEEAELRAHVRTLDGHQDMFRQMFRHSIVPTLIHDLEMNILDVNDAAVRLFGYDREELLQKSVFDLHTESELEHSREVLAEMQQERTLSVRSSFKRKDGSAFYAEATPTQFLLDDKLIIHVFIQDITLQIERETKARAYVEELEQFAYITSHDLREPLRTIISFAELLEEDYADRLGDEGSTYLGYISAASDRMRRLVSSLLSYSRLGKREPLSEIDGTELVQQVVTDLQSLIADTDATVEIGTLPQLLGYREKLRVMVQILLTNAMQFAKPGVPPEVQITGEETQHFWKVAVSDNGIGIAPEFHEKIFLVFQRLARSRPHDGTGIGLSSCRKIARMHGGEVTVDSRPGEGSTFVVTISRRLE